MRIISGKFKGTKLFIPLDKKTRPLKDLVKEAIFNTLRYSVKCSLKLKNTKILDLFSGTGSYPELPYGLQYNILFDDK